MISKRAQSVLEYMVVIALIAAALIATATLIRRSIQARFRQSADVLGEGELR